MYEYRPDSGITSGPMTEAAALEYYSFWKRDEKRTDTLYYVVRVTK